jgi:hypothetical protein
MLLLQDTLELTKGMYSVFLPSWLEAWPREQLLVRSNYLGLHSACHALQFTLQKWESWVNC